MTPKQVILHAFLSAILLLATIVIFFKFRDFIYSEISFNVCLGGFGIIALSRVVWPILITSTAHLLGEDLKTKLRKHPIMKHMLIEDQ